MAANDIFKKKPEKIIASGVMLDTGMDVLATSVADPEIGQGKTKNGEFLEATCGDPIFDLFWLIHIAGSRLRSLLGLGFLYYAEISHWFGSRL